MKLTEKSEREILNKMFRPGSVAIIGASARAGSLGNMVMKKMVDFGYTGDIYPINPKPDDIMGRKSYKSVLNVPGEIDLAVFCIPGQFVIPVFDECHRRGIRSAVIISAGFKEIGPEGLEREKELKRLGAEYGIRIIGPNCFGIINGDPAISMDCTFARYLPPRGHVGLISQSGAMGACIMEDLKKTQMGLSVFASLGNRCDFDENEALEYLGNEENTKVILMYLENFSDPARFLETARRVSRKKPVIALKAGRSAHGAQAAASHTGQMAQSDRLVEALLEKAGVIRVLSVEEMIVTANALHGGILPGKESLAVITNAGGFGVMAIDRAEELGIELADFSPATTAYLEENLPVEASCKNPVDLLGTAGTGNYRTALEGLLNDENVGGVICNFGPPVMQSAEEIAVEVVNAGRKHPEKPLFAIYMNRNRIMKAHRESEDRYVPQFDYPESAVWAYSQMLKYKRILNRQEDERDEMNVDSDTVESIIDGAIQRGADRLDFNEGERVLRAYNIPVAKSVEVMPEDVPEKKMKGIVFPVAVKPLWGGVTHKTEMNAVRLNLKDVTSLKRAMNEVSESIEKATGQPYRKGFIVQEMVVNAREVIMGAVRQEAGLGLVMFGLGGIFVELLKDVAFGIAPLSKFEANGMIGRIKGYPLLKGFRGQVGVNLPDLEDILVKLSLLIRNHPRISELDMNPIMAVAEPGLSRAVDVRIILGK